MAVGSEFVGATLATWECNYYDDSDFMASVWDGEKVVEVMHGSTRFAGGVNAVVDASDDVKAAAGAWLGARQAAAAAAAATAEAKVPAVGKAVKVVKGRKVPVGVEGMVVWVGEDRYGSNRWVSKYRVGLVDADGVKHFTAMGNVEVVDPEVFGPEDFPFDPMAVRFTRPDEHAALAVRAAAKSEAMAGRGEHAVAR